jgi:hypothetical protein
MRSGAPAEKRSRAWFWFLIIAIFVLYCLAWRRPFCQTLDGLTEPTEVLQLDMIASIRH